MLIAARQSCRSGIWPLNSDGRLGAVRLVLAVLAGAERLPRRVERHGQVRRLLGLDEVDQHREEPVDAVRVLPVLRREVVHGKGEEGPICQRMAVHDEEGRLCGVRHPASSSQGGRHPIPPRRGRRTEVSHGRESPRERRRPRLGDEARDGRARREDGHGVRRVLDRAVRRDDARRGQHPARRAHARRRVRRARRVARLDGREPPRRPRPARRRRRHQRHAHAFGDVRRRHRGLHAGAPRPQRSRCTRSSSPTIRDAGARRSGSRTTSRRCRSTDERMPRPGRGSVEVRAATSWARAAR